MLSTLYFASNVYVCSHVAGLFWQYMSVKNHKYTIWLNYISIAIFTISPICQKPWFKTHLPITFQFKTSVPEFNIAASEKNPWIADGVMTWSTWLKLHHRWRSPRSSSEAPNTAATSPSPGQQGKLVVVFLFSFNILKNMSFTLKPSLLLITCWNLTYDYPSSLTSLGLVRGGDKFQTESCVHMQYSTISFSIECF